MDFPVFIWIRRCHFAIGLGLLALFLTTGCISRKSETEKEDEKRAQTRAKSAQLLEKSVAEGQREISIEELDRLVYAFADRYYMEISSAVELIKRNNNDPTQRRIAEQLLRNGILSMDDIASGNDPYTKVFDVVSSVTLQSMLIIDENRAEQVFGDRAPFLITSIRTMRVEAWDLAAKVLRQAELELLDHVIIQWRRDHPEIQSVAYVKFDNFAAAHAANLVTQLRAGHGFLAPLHEATEELADTRRLTERIFWYSKRAPNIAAIQAEGAVSEILATPEIHSAIQTSDRIGKLVESVPKLIDKERETFLTELDARQAFLTNTLGNVRHIVGDIDSLAGTVPSITTNVQQTLVTLNDTLKVAGQVGRDLGLNQPSTNVTKRPFDIQDYTAAFERLNEAVTNLQQLSSSANNITRSEGWKQTMADMSTLMDLRINRIFTRILMLLGLAFVLTIIYRMISLMLARRIPPSPRK